MTAPRRIKLPPLEQIDQGVRHLLACHDYVDATGQPAYQVGEFPVLDDGEDA